MSTGESVQEGADNGHPSAQAPGPATSPIEWMPSTMHHAQRHRHEASVPFGFQRCRPKYPTRGGHTMPGPRQAPTTTIVDIVHQETGSRLSLAETWGRRTPWRGRRCNSRDGLRPRRTAPRNTDQRPQRTPDRADQTWSLDDPEGVWPPVPVTASVPPYSHCARFAGTQAIPCPEIRISTMPRTPFPRKPRKDRQEAIDHYETRFRNVVDAEGHSGDWCRQRLSLRSPIPRALGRTNRSSDPCV